MLRSTEPGGKEAFDQHGLRIGKVHPSLTTPQVIASASGGRVIMLDGDSGTILDQTEDYGFGGMALALHDLDGDGDDEVLFAPTYDRVEMVSMGNTPLPLQSRLRALDHDGGGGNPSITGFQELDTAPIGDPQGFPDFPGYGACGIAVNDLDGDGTLEVIVTTLNGELVILPWTGQAFGSASYYGLFESGLGAFNSIVVHDLDGDQKKEVYIASSAGIRRFDVP